MKPWVIIKIRNPKTMVLVKDYSQKKHFPNKPKVGSIKSFYVGSRSF